MIRISKPAKGPPILTGKQNRGPRATRKLKEDFDQGIVDFKFDSGIYAAKSVKNKLIQVQQDKCCYCESRFTHVAFGDVEHYRPKGGWTQNPHAPLTKPGYYWLAYEWSNLLVSCALCNQRFKRNYFPLMEPAKRARSHHDDLSQERPLILHPVDDNPEDFIGFREEHPYGLDDDNRGAITIAAFGLDREELEEMRRTRLAKAKLIHKTVMILRQFKERQGELQPDLENLLREHEEVLKGYSHPSTEYQAMLRAAGLIAVE